ncbi:AAA family ATPase [Desulfobacterota bacterium AH_259_B03_O07]|nr:AAA family ATPase [Desulfobacterota bacterium AH_259_B03_O07]
MVEDEPQSAEEAELRAAIEAVLSSPSDKKLVIAGPGTGKTTLFEQLLELAPGHPDQRIVLTFVNNLKDDLNDDLGGLAQVFTLHSYCLGLLQRDPALRGSLSPDFRCCPGIASIIAEDWEVITQSDAPKFVGEMRALSEENQIPFYLARGEYYDAVDFDDTVYRAYEGLSFGRATPESYDLVLIDEYQDFNALEAGVIDALAERSPILIAGDDHQALYSQLRDASWDHIRLLSKAGEYDVFKLPFCMRCPKVVVDAVNDVLTKAEELGRLEGRIEKPYKHFPPAKGADRAKYSKIVHVEPSVQRQDANYMGRYLAQAIAQITEDEIKTAAHGGYPAALVIVAQPYRDQIVSHLEAAGYVVDTRRNSDSKLNREAGISILKVDRVSNLGWRIVLGADAPSFLKDAIVTTADCTSRLVDVVPDEYRERVLAEVDAYEPPEEVQAEAETPASSDVPSVRVTSFEGAKGLSAQHVYIAGLHNGELPHDPASIKDLEICKFVVALTRTRKKCTLIRTRNFAGNWKTPSSFISWIDPARLEFIKVDAQYWKQQAEEASEN